MEKVLQDWDGEYLVVKADPVSGAMLLVAVHSTRRGPASGGTRAMTYSSLAEAVADAARLSKAMTYKMAMADLPMGGGKSVIALPQTRGETSETEWGRLLDLHARTLETLHGDYWTGPDVNTTSDDMDRLRRSTKYAFGASPAFGGSGSSAPDTALGVFVGIKATLAAAGLGASVRNRSILVQGAGAVGHRLAELCLQDGAVVLVADVDEHRFDDLVAAGAHAAAADSVPLVACDVYAPCAIGGCVTTEVAERIECRAVAGAANNPLATDSAADVLASRGILYAPDYVINAGGAIHLIGEEILGWSHGEVRAHIEKIGSTLEAVYERSEDSGQSTETTARQLALERLGAAPDRGIGEAGPASPRPPLSDSRAEVLTT